MRFKKIKALLHLMLRIIHLVAVHVLLRVCAGSLHGSEGVNRVLDQGFVLTQKNFSVIDLHNQKTLVYWAQ